MHNQRLLILLGFLASVAVSAIASGDTLFDNYNESSTPPYNTGDALTVIQKDVLNLGSDTETAAFFSPSTDASLTSITLAFAKSDDTDSGVFNFSLRADDNSGLPGTVIESWDNVSVNAIQPAVNDVVLTSVLNPKLLQADVYWIVASAANNDSFGGWYVNTTGASGNANLDGYVQLTNEGDTFGGPPNIVSNPSLVPAFQVDGTPTTSTSVPTPAAALAAIPLLSVVAFQSVRKRRIATAL